MSLPLPGAAPTRQDESFLGGIKEPEERTAA